jgi:hypothetical protein
MGEVIMNEEKALFLRLSASGRDHLLCPVSAANPAVIFLQLYKVDSYRLEFYRV